MLFLFCCNLSSSAVIMLLFMTNNYHAFPAPKKHTSFFFLLDSFFIVIQVASCSSFFLLSSLSDIWPPGISCCLRCVCWKTTHGQVVYIPRTVVVCIWWNVVCVGKCFFSLEFYIRAVGSRTTFPFLSFWKSRVGFAPSKRRDSTKQEISVCVLSICWSIRDAIW